MSNSSLSTAYGRCFVIFIAIVILLEGVVYFGFSLWGITQRSCSAQTDNVSSNPFQFATDMLYFISETCNQKLVVNVNNAQDSLNMNWEDSFAITNRMYIFIITYMVISVLWILLSLMVLFSICGAITKTALALFFWPWFSSVIAGSILDAVATGFFIDDITHTTSAQSAFEYVGADVNGVQWNQFSSYDSYFVTPAIVMTCISSRLVVIWLLNVFGVSFCISLVQAMVKSQTAKPKAEAAVAAAVVTQAYAVEQHEPESPEPRAIETPMYVEETQIRPKPLPIQTPPETPTNYQSGYPQSPPDRRSYQQQPPLAAYAVSTAAQANQNVDRRQSAMQPLTPAVIEDTSYRNTETHPDRLNYPPPPQPQRTPSVMEEPARPPPPEFSTDSILNNRYAVDPVQQQLQQQQHNQRVSDELRSQLPWSYTSMLLKPPPPPPPKPKPQLKIYPEIPEPDYAAQRNSVPPAQEGYSRW